MEHGGGIGEGADSARGLDAGAGARDRTQEGDVVGGGSSVGEAGGGFEEVRPGGESYFAGTEFFLEGEQAGFEDDLDDGTGGVGQFDDAADVLADGFEVLAGSGFEQSDVQDHVDVVGAKLEDAGSLVALGRCETGSEGEADDHADGDSGSSEGFDSSADPDRVDHGTGEAVLGGFVAELDNLGACGVGPQQGVVENGGEGFGRGEGLDGELFGVVPDFRVGGLCGHVAPCGSAAATAMHVLSYGGFSWFGASGDRRKAALGPIDMGDTPRRWER